MTTESVASFTCVSIFASVVTIRTCLVALIRKLEVHDSGDVAAGLTVICCSVTSQAGFVTRTAHEVGSTGVFEVAIWTPQNTFVGSVEFVVVGSVGGLIAGSTFVQTGTITQGTPVSTGSTLVVDGVAVFSVGTCRHTIVSAQEDSVAGHFAAGVAVGGGGGTSETSGVAKHTDWIGCVGELAVGTGCVANGGADFQIVPTVTFGAGGVAGIEALGAGCIT